MRRVALSVAFFAALAAPTFADAVEETAAPKEGAAPPEMSAEEKAAMEAYEKGATPGPQHAALEPTVGTFDATVTNWMKPGAEPMTSPATSESQWIFDGRYIEQRFHGNMMGQPFEGRGYTGYDNTQGKYTGVWMDSMSTGMMPSVGEATGKGTFKFEGTYWDPMTGKATLTHFVLSIKSANEHVFEMYGPGPDGKEYKMMEIVYKRRMM